MLRRASGTGGKRNGQHQRAQRGDQLFHLHHPFVKNRKICQRVYLLKTVLSIQTRFPRICSADFAFLFLGSTAQLQLRPSPNALAELCGAALVLTEKFYYNKGMFWKRMYGEDDCRVFFPGKTECARAARRTGGRGRAAERTGV